MSGANPGIILGYNPRPLGPDFSKTLGDAQQMLQIQQQQEQQKRQNALLGIFKDPNALDQTGNPTTETLQKVMSVDPPTGMAMRQNMMMGQERQLHIQALNSDQMAKKMGMINESLAPIFEGYQTAIKNGTPEQQARRDAQAALIQSNERMGKSGVFTPDEIGKFPTSFDPTYVQNAIAGTEQYQNWRKENLAEQRNLDAGSKLLLDKNKRMFTFRPNAPVGQQNLYQDHTPVPDDAMMGVTTVGAAGNNAALAREQDAETIARIRSKQAGGEPLTVQDQQDLAAAQARVVARNEATPSSSAATADRRSMEFVARNKYEAELGHPVTTPDEQAELQTRILKAETNQKATSAGAVRTAQADAAAKPIDVLVDGKPQQALWKSTGYTNLDGSHITGDIRSAKAATPAAAAELDAMTVADARIKAAEQQRGAPLSEEEKAEIRRTARSDPKVQEAIRKNEGTAISDEAAKLIAEETLAGDFHGTVGMGRNQASMRKIADFRGRIADERHMTGADLAFNTAEFNGVIAAERTLGVRGAGIDTGIQEAKRFGPMVLEASDKIDRTRFPTVNSIELAAQKGVGGEDIVRLIDAMNAYKMAYTQILTRGGMPTDDARRRSDEIIDTAWSNGQIKAAVDQLSKEMDGAQSSIPAVRDDLYHTLTGKYRDTVPPPRVDTSKPPTAEQLKAAPRITNDDTGQNAYKALGPNTLFIAPDGQPHWTTPDKKPETQPGPRATAAQPAVAPVIPPVPTGLPPKSQWSPSRKMWRDPSGKIYDADGKPVGG
jgi:hypothetical protein